MKTPLQKTIFQSEDCCFTSNKELFLQDSQKESNLACFMASVAPSSPTLVVGAVWKITILGKPALIITTSQAHHLIYIWHALEVKIWARISFSGTTNYLSKKAKPLYRGDSFTGAKVNLYRNFLSKLCHRCKMHLWHGSLWACACTCVEKAFT